jgi:hypothetical protein
MRMIKRIKIPRANGKKALGVNRVGYKIRRGNVPVSIPIGHRSVNMKPTRVVVRNTRAIKIKYFV